MRPAIKLTSCILWIATVRLISPFYVVLIYIIYGAFVIYRFLFFALNLIVDICFLCVHTY
jgi:hypothetical protein